MSGYRKYISVCLFFFCGLILLTSCRKNPGLNSGTDAKLNFSSDTVLFDTVFTTVGSSTQWLKVYNPYKERIIISDIRLAGGSQSQFRLNVDGVAGNEFSNIELMPEDSLFIFVEVTVNPVNSNSPLIVTDSILFKLNGNLQDVDLVAWGQDAHYIRADRYVSGLPPYSIVARENEVITWTNDKPWVIYGYAVVDSTGTLNIEAGTRVHFHKNSGLWIYRYGKLNVNGTIQNRVYFQGDRLDQSYSNVPGQWDRIWINEGARSQINYAVIKNGFIGIQAQTLFGRDAGDQTELRIRNTIIQDMKAFGLYTVYFNVQAYNSIIHACGEQTVAITLGGSYSFRHCTLANMDQGSKRQNASVIINNYNDAQTIPLDSAYFGNCILYGTLDNELSLDADKNSVFEYWFDHCVIKADTSIDLSNTARFIDVISNPKINNNPDPLFINAAIYDYHLTDNSAALDKGNPNLVQILPADIDDRFRSSPPDIGAYEK